MDGAAPLEFWYVSVQLVSAVVLAVTGYLVYTRHDAHHRAEFVAYVAVQTLWLLVATVKFLVESATLKYALSLSTDLLAVAVTGIVTQPLLGLQYASVSYRETPFAYLATTPGPAYLLNATVAAVVVVVSLGYLAELFISSTHRPTSSVLLLVAAAVASLLPNAVSTWTELPLLPGYDYTVFGIVPLSVILAYTVFFRGWPRNCPFPRPTRTSRPRTRRSSAATSATTRCRPHRSSSGRPSPVTRSYCGTSPRSSARGGSWPGRTNSWNGSPAPSLTTSGTRYRSPTARARCPPDSSGPPRRTRRSPTSTGLGLRIVEGAVTDPEPAQPSVAGDKQ